MIALADQMSLTVGSRRRCALLSKIYRSTRVRELIGARLVASASQTERPARARKMMRLIAGLALPLAITAGFTAHAQADRDTGRGTVLARLSRGSAAFRNGDMISASREWSEAIRSAQLAKAPDLEAQALARRGELYRILGYLRSADTDLREALAKAENSGNQNLIAASSGALANLELGERHLDQAEPLLLRSHDLASRLGDRNVLAASANDLGNLYAQTGRNSQAATAYAEAIAIATTTGDLGFAATAEINAARLASRRDDLAGGRKLLVHAIDTLERLSPSYSTGVALLSAGSVA
jgi:tetratricopeptide (TPR) repeat protein